MPKPPTIAGAIFALSVSAMLCGPALAQTRNVAPLGLGGASAARLGVAATADFGGVNASADVRCVAGWVAASGDNDGLPFIIVDKRDAEVFVFDRAGRLRGATSALLGMARGDDAVSGIGNEKLSRIPQDERTTPAGRFVAQPGHDLENDVLWIDYGNSLALHRVAQGGHRPQRLATGSLADKRITYGCVEVSAAFYDDVVDTTFAASGGIIYILPEIKTVQDVFPQSGGAYSANGNNAVISAAVR